MKKSPAFISGNQANQDAWKIQDNLEAGNMQDGLPAREWKTPRKNAGKTK